jgi:tRNA(fMet)-specific endonuclease VapC
VILLDTNICIHVINARPPAVLERFREDRMVKSGSTRNRQALEMVLAPLVILPFDEAGL